MHATYWQKLRHIEGPQNREQLRLHASSRVADAARSWIIENSTPETSLLDAGCNTGIECYALYAQGYVGKYTGVDSNKRAVLVAEQNLKSDSATFLAGELEQLQFPAETFEIVLLKEVLEHQLDFRPVLKEAARVCSDALISVSAVRPSNEERLYRHPRGYYLNAFKRSALDSELESLGFSTPEYLFENISSEVSLYRKKD